MSYRPARVKVRAGYVPDPDEEMAFQKAVESVRELRAMDPERIAYYCISSWILERNRIAMVTNEALAGTAWTLDDSHLRGMALALLPQVATALGEAELDGSKPFYELSQEDICSVVVCCFLAMRDATRLNDQVPF